MFPAGGVRNARPFREFFVLESLRRSGVPVPEPLAAYVEIGFFGLAYSGCIAMREIAGARNVLEILKEQKSDLKLEAIAAKTGLEAGKMVDAGVTHADLHLGNVLLVNDEVVLIDFDKARFLSKNEDKVAVRQVLADRWDRSVIKHSAGDGVSKRFREALFS